MAEAQEKRPMPVDRFIERAGLPPLLDIWMDDSECRLLDRECTARSGPIRDRLVAVIGKVKVLPFTNYAAWAIAEALLDKLDEAKRLHEVERDRANDLLSDRQDAERERDEAKAQRDEAIDDRAEALSEQARAEAARDEARDIVTRLATEVARLTGREVSRQGMQNDIAWVPVEVERLLREVKLNEDLRGKAERERNEAKRDIAQLRRIAIDAINETDGWSGEGVSIQFLSGLPGEVAGLKKQRNEARAEVERMRQLEDMADRALHSAGWTMPNTMASPAWVADGIQHITEQRDEARAEVERMRREAAEQRRRADNLGGDLGAANANIEELQRQLRDRKAEVERLRKERTDAERTAVDEAQAANKAIGRVAELEKAAQEAVRCWFSDGLHPVRCTMLRLRDLVGDPDFEVQEDARPTLVIRGDSTFRDPKEPGDQPTRDLAALLREYWSATRGGGESRGSDPVDVDVQPADPEDRCDRPATDPAALQRDLRLAALIRDLDKLVNAELNQLRDRLARLEAHNG